MTQNPGYEKMPKNFNHLNLTEKEISSLHKLQWVVTEKIHGANFSFVYEGNKLLFAKRKAYLKWTDDFFGFQSVVSLAEENITRLFEQLRVDIKAEKYIIYGELFGGKYPHPNVIPHPHIQAIQTGVYYCPSIHFCAFDIAVESNKKKQYLDYKSAIAYFEQFNLFYTKALFSGKLNEALNFDIKINSQIPAQFNLPEIASNLIEGVVIKPLIHTGLSNLPFRPILKLKNPEFDEEKKFHEAEKWSYIPIVTSHSEELSFLVDEMTNYITRNRLNNVMSKIGGLDLANEKRLSEIKHEFLQDILIDFNDNNNKILDAINTRQKDWVSNRIQIHIAAFINKFIH
jgi:Rnl2 family RNA ligase